MDNSSVSRQIAWSDIIDTIQLEWRVLGEADRVWISGAIRSLAVKQQSLHQLVAAVDGEDICRDCGGVCCGHGCYHPTLVTILAHLVLHLPLPLPDFNQSCPYLGVGGCQFLPQLRPYNCLTFICERIDERTTPIQSQAMRDLELEIRFIYEQFDQRYVGSNLRGLLNRATDDGGQPLLQRRDMLN